MSIKILALSALCAIALGVYLVSSNSNPSLLTQAVFKCPTGSSASYQSSDSAPFDDSSLSAAL